MKADRKVKILFMIDYFEGPCGGGTERQLLDILRHLDRSRFQPLLCCLRPAAWTQDHAAPFDHVVLFSKEGRWISAPFSIARIRSFIRARGFDIVHTFFPTSNLLGTLAARLAFVPVILSSRRDLGYWMRSLDRILLRAIRRVPTHYLANSYAVKRQSVAAEGIDPNRILVVHNGADVHAYGGDFGEKVAAIKNSHHVPSDALIVGVVANYCRRVKGIKYFIEAAELVAAQVENVRFFVVGSGREGQQEHLSNLIRQLQLDGRFVFAGSQDDIRPFLRMFDVAVLPSLSEGFSNSLLEYMAAGLPSVATAVGGNGELIANGQSGFLVRPASSHALAEKIVLLLKDAGLRERFGRNARETVKTRFSMERMIGAMERIYESLYHAAVSSENAKFGIRARHSNRK
jgi:glycosyltransferase involved in cell wall biosynthesis